MADATYNLNGGFKPTMKRFADLNALTSFDTGWPRSRNLYQRPVRPSLSSMEPAGAAALITMFLWKTVTARRTDPQRALAATSQIELSKLFEVQKIGRQ